MAFLSFWFLHFFLPLLLVLGGLGVWVSLMVAGMWLLEELDLDWIPLWVAVYILVSVTLLVAGTQWHARKLPAEAPTVEQR